MHTAHALLAPSVLHHARRGMGMWLERMRERSMGSASPAARRGAARRGALLEVPDSHHGVAMLSCVCIGRGWLDRKNGPGTAWNTGRLTATVTDKMGT
eukprot:354739-Chlamydomonas_euryale.AAC.4